MFEGELGDVIENTASISGESGIGNELRYDVVDDDGGDGVVVSSLDDDELGLEI